MSFNKSQSILEIGQRLTQMRGYNAFSYADISDQVKIRKASIHYYFPSKEDLGRKLVMRYRRLMRERLHAIAQSSADPHEQLRGLVQLYQEPLLEERLCLCTMLSAEFLTLPLSVQTEVRMCLKELEDWVSQVIQTGQTAGLVGKNSPAQTVAQSFLAGLQGAQMLCRTLPQAGQWEAITAHLLDRL